MKRLFAPAKSIALPFKVLLVLLTITVLINCTQVPKHPLYEQSNGRYTGTGFNSFEAYQSATRSWLENNRIIIGQDKDAEIEMNMPFSIEPAPSLIQKNLVQDNAVRSSTVTESTVEERAVEDSTVKERTGEEKSKGIILVHGLGDSPWSFRDLAQEFANKGYLVRTLLLAGHGTRPADMLSVDDSEWVNLVREQVAILKIDVDEVSLGGFSTGANLVTSYALNDPEIQSLFLFSPAFQSDSKYDFLTPVAAALKDWIFTPSPSEIDNQVRYSTVPLNAFAQYYRTSASVQELLGSKTFNRPVFIATSEADSVVNVQETVALFEQRFTHPASRLAWFGSDLKAQDSRIEIYPGRVPEFNISNFSHMGILFAPTNSYYGQGSPYRMCRNGQTDIQQAQCEQGAVVWYSAWGYQEEDKAHARLTFNPYFEQMMEQIEQVILAN